MKDGERAVNIRAGFMGVIAIAILLASSSVGYYFFYALPKHQEGMERIERENFLAQQRKESEKEYAMQGCRNQVEIYLSAYPNALPSIQDEVFTTCMHMEGY